MVFSQTLAQLLEAFFRRIDEAEQIFIFRRDRAGIDEDVEVQHAIPVFAAVDQHNDLFRQLLSLG